MRATATTEAPIATAADTVAVGVFDDEGIPHDLPGGPLEALLDAGEARRRFRHLALTHAEGRRWLVVGLGERARFDSERARVAAATVVGRARELGARVLCWELPHHVGDAVAGALVEGTLLGAYRFDRYRTAAEPGGLEELVVSAHHDIGAAVARGAILAEAANAARDLGNAAPNDMTPAALAERARALEGLEVEVEGREQIEARGMGAFAAVARGSYEKPQLIVLRHAPPNATGPHLALVGKAVTFDSGGLSIKTGPGMWEQKYDMGGGAAVVEAMGAIARLGLPARVTGVVGATENMPSGRSMRPGDVLRAMDGTTIEVVNTDAEGRLVLADCLLHARALGAERLVDVATLTGSIVSTFASTHAGVMSNDDAWADAVLAACERTGEIAWRLPLHEEYDERARGLVADLRNTTEPRHAGAIVAASFLRRFAGDVPWAHLDIAGVADGLGRAYAPKGASGWGVRMLVELAEAVSARERPPTT